MPRRNQDVTNANDVGLSMHLMKTAVNGEVIQDYPKVSTKALYIKAITDPAEARDDFEVAGNLKESGEFTPSSDGWYEVRWDDSVMGIILQPRTNGLKVATSKNRTSPNAYGIPVAAGSQLLIKTTGAGKGAIFIANSSAGNNFVLDYLTFGELGLLNSPEDID